MKVLFLQTVHTKDDDRIRYHQQMSLVKAGHDCIFASSTKTLKESDSFDIAICDTPKAVWQAKHFLGHSTKIVYDITEWYPSKKNMRNASLLLKPLKWCVLLLASLYVGCTADAFLFGEYHKAVPFQRLFPWKRTLDLTYYPSLHYIPAIKPREITDEVRLFYAGRKTREKGFERVVKVKKKCQEKMPNMHIVLNTLNGVSFEQFCETITTQDFFLDLRDDDMENTRCLPIKLFYYLAAGRPIVYSDLKAIRRAVPEVVNDSLVKPDDIDSAAQLICHLVTHPEEYEAICIRNRRLAEEKYNWSQIENKFVEFIEKLQ